MSKSDVSLDDPEACWQDENSRSVGYFARRSISAVSQRLIDQLKEEAFRSGENARLSLHHGPDDDGTHEMFIVQLRDRVHPPKKHEHKAKSFHVIEGQMAVFAFNEAGTVVDFKVLGDGGEIYYRVEKGVYHADMALTDYVVHHETTEGPFLGDNDCVWASWAPSREQMGPMLEYRDKLFGATVYADSVPNRIIVTGAAGFVGSRIVSEISRTDMPALALARPGSISPDTRSDNVRIMDIDLGRLSSLPEDAAAIIHAAARLGVGDYRPTEIARNNVGATQNLAELSVAAGVRRFIFLSAISAYGQVSAQVVDEDTAITNPDTYGLSKLFGEEILAEKREALPSVSLRLPSIVGAGARHGWLNGAARALLDNQPIELVNPATPFNNIVHVDDLAAFTIELTEAQLDGAGIFCLSSSEPVPIGEALEYLKTKLGSSSTITHKSDSGRPGFSIDSGKAQDQLGWKAPPVSEVLDRLAADLRP